VLSRAEATQDKIIALALERQRDAKSRLR